jgi:hypothetical protein
VQKAERNCLMLHSVQKALFPFLGWAGEEVSPRTALLLSKSKLKAIKVCKSLVKDEKVF